MSDRGMMKWAPFRSLNEQGDFMKKMEYERGKREKNLILQEKMEKIDNILRNYDNEEVEVQYFDDGYIYSLSGQISSINKDLHFLKLGDVVIPFDSIEDITSADCFFFD